MSLGLTFGIPFGRNSNGAAAAEGPFVFDTSSRGTYGTSNPNVISHTCGADARLLVLTLGVEGLVERSGGVPTYNGVNMTDGSYGFLSGGVGYDVNVETWWLVNPAVGAAHNVSIPNTGGFNIEANVSSYSTIRYTSV